MHIISLIKSIEASLTFLDQSDTIKSSATYIAGGFVQLFFGRRKSTEVMFSSRSVWMDLGKQDIARGKSNLLLVLKEVIVTTKKADELRSLNSLKAIDYIYQKIYGHQDFDAYVLLYMAYASRFEGLYFGFDYNNNDYGVSLLNNMWFIQSAKYLARMLYADINL